MSATAQEVESQLGQALSGLAIPPCPDALVRLLDETHKPEPDLQRVGDLIKRDVGLAASMLKTVNSPFYGLRSKATTVHQALTLLGLLNVMRMVSGLLLRRAFPVDNNPVLEDFWRSSASIALVSAQLAPLMNVDRDEAYTFALFRDCGIPLLATRMPGYTAFLNDTEVLSKRSFTDVEEVRFGVTHTEVGRLLAKEWLLPDPLVDAVHLHHEYEGLQSGKKLPERSCRLVAVALVAEWLYFRSTSADALCHEWRKGGAFALQCLGTTVPEIEAQRPVVARMLAEHAAD